MKFTLLVLPLLAACGPSYFRRTSDCPTGYVPLDTARGEFKGRAMSAGGVVIAIRQLKNEKEDHRCPRRTKNTFHSPPSSRTGHPSMPIVFLFVVLST